MNELEKGKALFEKQEYKEAINMLTNFLLEQNNNADALYTRAMCFRKTEAYEKSVQDLNAILSRLPNEPTLLCERGISHFHNKDIESAMKDMNKAVKLDPENSFRYSSRAYIRANIDAKGAVEDYKKAIELDPKDNISLNNLGLLEENMGKMTSAKNRFKASDKIIGYDPEKRQENENNKLIDKKIQATTIEKSKVQEKETIGRIMLNVFISKATRKEYLTYIKSLFKK
jgi:tetratricopeptide (TPR) repeat protein